MADTPEDDGATPSLPSDIQQISITDEMRKSYLDYAMSVIVSRALPDVRDGLKPVHRRILFSMNEQGHTPDRGYVKSARPVGDVMGKYHPHGDSAIYDTLVRLAQPFSMSLLLIEKGPGFKVVRKLDKLGYRGIDTAELLFEDCRVPAANLIGAQEGRGLQQVLNGLELGRINVAARGAGLARACLEESLRYAQQRRTFGRPIAEHQAIQIKLADMATRVEAARLLVEHAARAYDAGRRCDLEAGMAKLYATETALENSLEAMRIHGAYGYSKEFNIERYYRDAPLLAIGEGTNELQRIIIARELVKRHPA